MSAPRADWEAATRQADPLADRTIAAIVGPWEGEQPSALGMARLGQATRCMAQWTTNGSLADWEATSADPEVATALRAYLDEGLQLPHWARPEAIASAEAAFMAYGPLSCTLLFCASLPECYVLPQLAEVLHVAGQLEAHTEHRIRQTAAMVFPVMLRGGLTDPAGSGVAQVLKVRLIHATIRHLILHGDPASARGHVAAAAVPPAAGASLHQALVAHGWDVQARGLPCSQLELAYTLLTFSYVFLQGMRSLGVPLSPAQERDYLHAWNVAGHVLGIRPELMAHGMEEAAVMFHGMQAMARAQPAQPDVRPALGRALVDTMAKAIRLPVLRGVPVPLTRFLVGSTTAHEIGVDERVSWPTRLAFTGARVTARTVDGIVRLVLPSFSLTRMLTRVVGYHLLTRFLLEQTRPLALPQALLQPMQATVAGWHHDPCSPGWVNRLEDRWTTRGEWRGRPREGAIG